MGARHLWSIEVYTYPTLDPFGDDAFIDHAPVDSFGADVTIALGPLIGNSVCGLLAFGIAATLTGPLGSLGFLWLGTAFALTAFPSRGDTETVLETARSLSPWVRPAGYLLAAPLRAVTLLPLIGGVAGYFWIFVLYAVADGYVAG